MNRVFFFYKSYITDVEGCFTEKQFREYLNAVISYGVTGTCQIEDSSILPAFIQRKASIDASLARYERAVINGKKGGRKKRITKEMIIEALKIGVPVENLARFFKCSEKTISRRFSKLEFEELNMLQELRFEVQRDNRIYNCHYRGSHLPRNYMPKSELFLMACDEYGIKSDYIKYFKYLPRLNGHKWMYGYHPDEDV